jgi:hypothetical protein
MGSFIRNKKSIIFAMTLERGDEWHILSESGLSSFKKNLQTFLEATQSAKELHNVTPEQEKQYVRSE